MNSSLSTCALMAVFLALTTPASAQRAKLSTLPPSMVASFEKNLDHKILPPDIKGTYVDRTQVSSLVSIGAPTITFLPLVFETLYNDGGGMLRNCGIYVQSERSAAFVVTVGPPDSVVTKCDALDAMSAMPGEGSHPRILLLYSVSSPSTHLHYPAVLQWDGHSNTYVLDAASTDDLGGSTTDAITISTLKIRLTKRTPESHIPQRSPSYKATSSAIARDRGNSTAMGRRTPYYRSISSLRD